MSRSKVKFLSVLKRKASESQAHYSQYHGYFDDYVLCRIRRDVTTKLGKAFHKGEVSICQRPRTGASSVVVWSFANRIDTSLPSWDVQILGGRGTQRWRAAMRPRSHGRYTR